MRWTGKLRVFHCLGARQREWLVDETEGVDDAVHSDTRHSDARHSDARRSGRLLGEHAYDFSRNVEEGDGRYSHLEPCVELEHGV